MKNMRNKVNITNTNRKGFLSAGVLAVAVSLTFASPMRELRCVLIT
jgi:hypothetical protein